MKRRDFIQMAGAPFVASTAADPSVSIASAADAARARSFLNRSLELSNGEFRLSLTAGHGLSCRLLHISSGTVLAEGNYSYSFGNPVFGAVDREAGTVVLSGTTSNAIAIQHRFTVDRNSKWIEEEITLSNSGPLPLDLHNARCGFVLPVQISAEYPNAGLEHQRFTAIPFVREPGGSRTQYADYSLSQILREDFESGLWENFLVIRSNPWTPKTDTPEFAAEGWVWRHPTQTFLVSKYSQAGMEWSILDRIGLTETSVGLRWGGFAIYRGNPAAGARILPGQSHHFGVTRLTAVAGDRNRAFYAFRDEMAHRGHRCPDAFNPPIHWNELYDNKLFFLPDGQFNEPAMRQKYYSLADMKEAAAKAVAIGCEALYLDPGWDTTFGSKIWDEPRLGSFRSFTDALWRDYRLKCSLHTPLSGWCDPSTYSPETYRVERNGERVSWQKVSEELGPVMKYAAPSICGASDQYVEETARRLKGLAHDGAVFFMFDGTIYHDACWADNHGHPVPARIEEHVQATLRLARMVHEEYPDVLIEMHDPVVGGFHSHYTPVYYGHGRCGDNHPRFRAKGFDSVWAFELMWKPMEDLISGRSIALYYYNLAYSVPLYIHIDLRTDNGHAVVFWWNASTCRHLGIGGTPDNPAVVEAHIRAMSTYKRLKPLFTSGVFYGIDEMTHVHSSADGKQAVINCFNLDNQSVEKKIRFTPSEIGLEAGKKYLAQGGVFNEVDNIYSGTLSIPARGHTLIEFGQSR